MGDGTTNSLSPQLRLATPADGPRLISLINAAFSIEDFLEGTRTDAERLAAAMEKGEFLVAEDAAGELLGSVYMERRGIGRLLMEAAEQQFRDEGLDSVEIIVLNLRPELPPLYQKFGYEVTGAEPFKPSRQLRPGVACHGITMAKKL